MSSSSLFQFQTLYINNAPLNKHTQFILNTRTINIVSMWKKLLLLVSILSSSFQSEIFECSHVLEHKLLISSGIPIKRATHNVCRISNVYQISEITEVLETKRDFSNVGVIYLANSTILKIPTIVFSRLPNLSTFSASNVQLMQIFRDDFKSAHNLTILVLNKNMIKDLEDNIFSQLKKLKTLDLSHNLIVSINEQTFKGCGDDLRQVDLSYNKINILDYSALVPLAHEKNFPLELKLDFNEIKEVRESHNVHHLHFEILSMKNNQLSSFTCPDVKIETLHLDNNHLETISMDNCSVDYMVITSNKLKWLHFHSDLKGLIASKNNIKSFIVNEPSSLYHMEMTENDDISHIFPTLKTLSQLLHLNLSNSFIGVLSENAFSQMTSLKYLHLKSCGIQIIPFESFSSNNNLLTLDLSENALETIDLHMFTGLEKLSYLDISGNKLSQIENIDKIKDVLPSLGEIKINRNAWKCLSLSTMLRTLNQLKIKISESEEKNFEVQNILGHPCY